MGFIAKTSDCLKDSYINRHFGQWSFFINRLTGLVIALYLPLHIFINSIALIWGGEAYTRVLNAMDTPLLKSLEVLLITAVGFHMFNGIRILLVDFFKMTRSQSVLTFFVFILSIALFIGALMLYWPYITGATGHDSLTTKL
jgi:succinate dehydrogenase / fumarate reductase cytochrome b subunit